MAFARGFGEYVLAVNVYFETATFALDEGDALYLIAVFVYEFFRQPGGAWSVGSILAVCNCYFHVMPPGAVEYCYCSTVRAARDACFLVPHFPVSCDQAL